MELIPGQNGLPPKRKCYSLAEKVTIVAKAAEVGVHPIAEAYGFPWQTVVSWKRYYEPIIIQSTSGLTKARLTGVEEKRPDRLSYGKGENIMENRISQKDEAGRVIAEITFHETSPGVFIIDHTFVDESLRGQGVASKLVQAAIDEIKKRGGQIQATCSYAKKWLKEHDL